MYKQNKPNKTSVKVNKSYEGERIEEKINRIVNNKEPIKDGAPIIFTDRSDGVPVQYNVRTDRFEVAIDAMDSVSKAHIAKRQHRMEERKKTLGEQAKENMKKEDIGGTKPLPATGGDNPS